MTTKTKVILSIVIVLASYAFGYFEAPYKIKTEIKTVEVEHKVTDTEREADKHKTTTTTEVVKPDGTKETTTTSTEDSVAKTDTQVKDDTAKTSDSTSETIKSGKTLNISALAGAPISFSVGSLIPVYGAQVSTNLIGPITVGLWGLSDKTAGFSLGLNL